MGIQDDSDFEDLNEGPAKDGVDGKEVEGGVDLGDNPDNAGTPDEKLPPEGDMLPISSSSPSSKTLTPRSSWASVAFFSVKRPAPSTAAFISVKRPVTSTSSTTGTDLHSAESETYSGNKEESFFNLLTGEALKIVYSKFLMFRSIKRCFSRMPNFALDLLRGDFIELYI